MSEIIDTSKHYKPHPFSVGKDKKALFSSGNFQYCPKTKERRFAPEQFNTIGKKNKNISNPEYDGWIDMFGWGTGDCPTKWCDPVTAHQGYKFYFDWGRGTKWRALSANEWAYITKERTDANEKWGLATIRKTQGFVLLPDEWNQPKDIDFAPSGLSKMWRENKYSLTEWRKMEKAGAVFLPAEGTRRKDQVTWSDYHGRYWTGTPCNWLYAYCFGFDAIDIQYAHEHRGMGCCVRLVTQV